jgi:hypothetical protein
MKNGSFYYIYLTIFHIFLEGSGTYTGSFFTLLIKYFVLLISGKELYRTRVSTEFRQHGIPYIFVTSVYSVCHTELPKIPRNYTEFRVTECCRIPRNFALHGISHDWVVTNRSS